MPGFSVNKDSIKDNEAVISGTDQKHTAKVLRIKAEDNITLFDSGSNECYGNISSVGKTSIETEIYKRDKRESPLNIILLQGLSKGDKTDYIVEKANREKLHSPHT